ncbi:hypothetical protein [Streptomyces sp. MK5]|uniref:hypothetical protein n=1 Tax=Streptomyces sp. MK5 TaxID=3064253 RepID=UPI002741AEFC|nr:hypothetical protein [Streptomyces sp. MK5]
MIMTRSHAVTAAVAAAAALAATGITYAAAAPAPEAAPAAAVQQMPAQAPMGGEGGNNNNSKGNEGNDHGDHGDHGGNRHRDYGWIHINERSYSAHPSGCITVVSGLGSNSLNIRNDSKKTVEVFRGVTCDNGAPIATVGPHSESNGVHPGCVKDGLKVKDGVVASFRVVQRHHGGKGDRDDY